MHFQRLSIEREERLQRLSTKITNSQAAKAPERSVKLAYIEGATKGSAQIIRKQKKYGTGIDSIAQCKLKLKGIYIVYLKLFYYFEFQ